MLLNDLHAAPGSRKEARRLGRGRGSGLGKTSGKGHKGQHARAGGYHKVGFEGGQMPIQRRLPKRGFRSKIAPTVAEIQLSAVAALEATEITLNLLKELNLIAQTAKRAKIIGAESISKAITVKGLLPTAGAKAAIEAAGGQVIA